VSAALLALDTATDRLHIGLAVDGQAWLHEGEGGTRASSSLIPEVRRLMSIADIGLDDLDAIAFGRGPGAFTGLRTACAVAQGLAFGANKPALPIDTLMAVAEDARDRVGTTDVWVVMDARMGEVYAGHYARGEGVWQTVVAPALYSLDDLHSRWQGQPPQSVAGTALSVFGSRLEIGSARISTDARPCASALLTCARAAWDRGLATDAAAALPLYLRDRVAFTIGERAAGKAERRAR